MKAKLFIILFIGIVAGAAGTYVYFSSTDSIRNDMDSAGNESSEHATQLYSCGMHPEVISDKPGNCPICGMKLTPIKGTAGGTETAQPGAVGKERKIVYWRAPMDPTEIYNEPGKSKMGMDLIPVYEGEEASGAGKITIDAELQQNMNLRIAPVEHRDITTVVRAYGKVTYAEDKEYAINIKISGWIEKLHVNTTGQRVQKGQTLLEIYSPELVSTQEEYLLALKNYKKLASSPYESVREGAERMLALTRDRLKYWDISDAEIDKIEQTGKTRRTIPLKSEMSGIVTHKAVVQGDKVGPGMDLFHIADLSKVWVEVAVYESELSLIKIGQKAELELDQVMGAKLEGTVDFIYPYLDQKSRANNVRLVFKNPDYLLKPDMYATVKIYHQAAGNVMAIPSEAVVRSGKRNIVFATRGDGKFEPREVTVGAESDDGYIQIVSGLFDDEQVVVSGQFLLDSESRTREAIAKMRHKGTASETSRKSTEEQIHIGTEVERNRAFKQQTQPSAEHVHETGKAISTEPEMQMKTSAERQKEQAPEETGHIHKATDRPHETTEQKTIPAEKQSQSSAETTKEHVHETAEQKLSLAEGKQLFTCPMHPDFLTTDKDGSCPICGMNLVKLDEQKSQVNLDGTTFYTCPMHPDFLTTDKDGSCPICGMNLEKVEK